MRTSVAYLNYGNWVADCPFDGCTDARAAYPEGSLTRVLDQVCADGHPFRIVMPPPDQEAAIVAAVAARPEARFKSWLPAGHPWAEHGYATGQTVKQLADETKAVERHLATRSAEKRESLIATLAEFGMQVRPDGTISGSLE